MKFKVAIPFACLSLASILAACAGEPRPGKGLTLIPGDFAEYSNIEYQGDQKTAKPSTLMVVMGAQDKLEGVQVISVLDGKLISNRTVFYDLEKEKVEQGELLESGKETLTIAGKQIECTWENRRNKNVTATFWRSPELPFEHYAKVQMQADDGRKYVTELVAHGPHIPINDDDKAFMKRLNELKSQKEKEK